MAATHELNRLDLSTDGTDGATWRRVVNTLPRRSAIDLTASRLVVISPHPDDETLGVGGIIADAARNGTPGRGAVLTDGEAATVSDRSIIGRQSLGSWRLRELRHALKCLVPNGSIRTVRCGLPDGRLDRAEEALRKILTSELRHSDLVLAPLLNDGHADHDAAGAAAREVCNVVGATCRYFPIWAWQWHTPGSSEISTNGIRIDLSTTAQAAKAAALACFPSQTSGNPPVLPEHFLQLFDESYEVIVSDEPTRVAAP